MWVRSQASADGARIRDLLLTTIGDRARHTMKTLHSGDDLCLSALPFLRGLDRGNINLLLE